MRNKIIQAMLDEEYLTTANTMPFFGLNKDVRAFWCSWENGWAIDPKVFFKWWVNNQYEKHYVYNIVSDFAKVRKSSKGKLYFHSGLDRAGKKADQIYSPIDGFISSYKMSHWLGYGVNIEIMNFFEEQEFVYKACHLLFLTDPVINKKIKAGDMIGGMGNTGHCLTLDLGKWRPVSKAEIESPICNRGVHLHEMVISRGVK